MLHYEVEDQFLDEQIAVHVPLQLHEHYSHLEHAPARHVVHCVLAQSGFTNARQSNHSHQPVVENVMDYIVEFNLTAYEAVYFSWYLDEARLWIKDVQTSFLQGAKHPANMVLIMLFEMDFVIVHLLNKYKELL